MPTPKLFTKQFQDKDGRTYLFFRYWDNHNNNYEYQVYELRIAKDVSRTLGSPELNNSREMCDWVWENVESFEGEYKEGKHKKADLP